MLYCVCSLPALLSISQYDTRRRQLFCLGHSNAAFFAQIIALVFHFGWSFLLIVYLRGGVYGAAAALSITYTTAFIVQECYVFYYKWSFFKDYHENLLQKESFTQWKRFFKLAVP